MGETLEFFQVIHYARAEEGGAVFQRGLVDDDGGAFGFDALHNTLDRALTEVVGVGFHREAIYADDAFALRGVAVGVGGCVVVPSGKTKHLVGNEVLARAVALYDGRHHVLGNVGVVGEQLLGVFRQAVAAVAE